MAAVAAVAAAAAVVVAVSFLINNCKQERHCASSLYSYHVHHIRNVQSFSSLFIRHLSRMPRQLVM